MGHDYSLGAPVDVGIQEGANHSGPCNDGVYGCSLCFNGANGGKGIIGTCEWCDEEDEYLIITRASDEPVSYAVCQACRRRQARALQAEMDRYESFEDYDPSDDD